MRLVPDGKGRAPELHRDGLKALPSKYQCSEFFFFLARPGLWCITHFHFAFPRSFCAHVSPPAVVIGSFGSRRLSSRLRERIMPSRSSCWTALNARNRESERLKAMKHSERGSQLREPATCHGSRKLSYTPHSASNGSAASTVEQLRHRLIVFGRNGMHRASKPAALAAFRDGRPGLTQAISPSAKTGK